MNAEVEEGREVRAHGWRALLRTRAAAALVLALAAGCFAAGIMLPVITLKRFFIFATDHSILSMIAALWADGEVLLAAILLAFSVLLPALKMALLAALLASGRAGRMPLLLRPVLDTLGKWSMLDVLVVALVIFAVRTSGIASALSRPGLYFFCASVVLTMIASALTLRRGAGGTG